MIEQVRPAQLSDWLQTHEAASPLVLDVREPWELQSASVAAQGFELVAIPMGQLPARLTELDPTRPTACLCHHGVRSLRVAVFLAQSGFGNVANITGGIDAWSHERDPAVPRY
ncbi:MAG: sulfurtransferase [Proteobacteria bacterium]|nr:sulfurtransferase [Pseudomonadota bacterium]MBS0493049.1 sulfurtransferase [Pseudomonadota bacterium]